MPNSLWPRGPWHTRLPCPSLSPRVCSDASVTDAIWPILYCPVPELPMQTSASPREDSMVHYCGQGTLPSYINNLNLWTQESYRNRMETGWHTPRPDMISCQLFPQVLGSISQSLLQAWQVFTVLSWEKARMTAKGKHQGCKLLIANPICLQGKQQWGILVVRKR